MIYNNHCFYYFNNYIKTMDQYLGRTITGKQLNELLNGMPLLKFMNDSDIHYGMHYVDGYNLDILPFNGTGDCSSGGLYITRLEDYSLYYDRYGGYARRVRILDTSLVYVEKNKFKCDEIFLEKRVLKEDLLKELFTEYTQLDENFLMRMVKNNGYALQFIKDEMKTHEIMLEAVKNSGDALQFIKDEMKTHEIMLEAVKKNGYSLQYIKDEMKTHEIMLEAVKKNGYSLQYIKNEMKTHEIMLEAVKKNGYSLQYIKDEMKTHEIMLEAVKNDGDALQYIKEEMRPEIMKKITEMSIKK
jgi:IMP cyclohydrolase